MVEAVGDVVKEQGAPDGVAGALKHAVGGTPPASVFPPARVVKREGTGKKQERDDEKGSSLGRPAERRLSYQRVNLERQVFLGCDLMLPYVRGV